MTLALGFGLGVTRQFSVGGGDAPPAFDPTSLFGVSDDGGWYDASDLTTLFQNGAGTIPVTADGDPIGCIRDKSGKTRHLIQPLGGSRPVYKTSGGLSWIQFASGQFLTEAAAGFIPVVGTYIGAAAKPTDASLGGIIGSVRDTNDRFLIFRQNSTTTRSAYVSDADASLISMVGGNNKDLYVDSQSSLLPGATVGLDLKINNVPTGSALTAAAAPSLSAGVIGLNIVTSSISGSTSTYNFYAGIVINRHLTAPERAACTTFFGAKAGLTL